MRWAGLGLSFAWLTAALCALNSAAEQGAPATPAQIELFEKRIRPVLELRCGSCHGKNQAMAGLRIDSREALLKGGESGPAIKPGDPDESLLIQAIRHEGPVQMPKGGKLDPREIDDLVSWVKTGAPWPERSPKAPDDSLWSLRPVVMPVIPKVRAASKVANPIDAFVLARLEAKGFSLAPPADRRTLLRRLTFDLTGLPPTPSETDAFMADRAPDAYAKVVDRLLGSPRYGERWARLWLDVARYADTKGYVFEEDRNYPNAYTYRDWVIQAFNDDLPYDRFILEQLAADRLPEVRDGEDKRPLAALGFLTVGRRFLNHPPDIIDDRIDVTMRGFQGLTVACARCHDHKFDPIPTQDYYSLYAVFANSAEVSAPISPRPIREPWESYRQKTAALESAIQALIVAQTKRLRKLAATPESAKDLSPETKQVLQSLREEVVPMGDPLAKLRKAYEPEESARLTRLEAELADLRKSAPAVPEFAMALADKPNPTDGVVFRRGVPGNPGEKAPRRFLLALTKSGVERELWRSGSGRLELGQAIASRENPLTARVLVNRVWAHHFGSGLVGTPSDFGHQGERPTHPELLDYLAAKFVDQGWSIKKLHRLIVHSATYRQSSAASAALLRLDPENRLWGRANRRRLDLEQMRDALVAASGRLDLRKVGGPSAELWSEPFSDRRAVYGFIERQNLPGTFRTFDFASPDSTSPRRFQTTVPQQALFFLNSAFSAEQARRVAAREELRNSADDAQRIRRLYRLLFSRLPDAEETTAGLQFLGRPNAASPGSTWQYGYGEFDPASGRVVSFAKLGHFSELSYRAGPQFPDPTLGWVMLNASGGHPGHDGKRAAIRRWIAPEAMAVRIEGSIRHGNAQGDGVRGRVVSSRRGLLGEWTVHNRSTRTPVAVLAVERGETLDFVVDPVTEESFDGFVWTVSLTKGESGPVWDSQAGFAGPPRPPLKRLELYVQALLMTNEFLFVD